MRKLCLFVIALAFGVIGFGSYVQAGNCTFRCQQMIDASTRSPAPGSNFTLGPFVGVADREACNVLCQIRCPAEPWVSPATFVSCVTGSGLVTDAPPPSAVVDGPCTTPVAGHADYICAVVSPSSRAFRQRHCVTGHCRDLSGAYCCAPVAAPVLNGGTPGCGHEAVAARTAGGAGAAGIDARIQEGWVCAIPSAAQQTQCATYTGCTPLNASAKCCPAGVGNTALGRPGATGAGSSAGGGGDGGAGLAGALRLPDCATSHDPNIAGKCSLDDIKQVGVNFANFLMGLAAAFFLLIFVYAGFKYIFFAYDSGTAGEARKMLTSSAIGMLLVLGAATIVRFVQTTATGRAPVEDRCASTKAGYSCQDASRLSDSVKRNCTPTTDRLCPGNASNRCCPTPAGTGLTPAGGATTPSTRTPTTP